MTRCVASILKWEGITLDVIYIFEKRKNGANLEHFLYHKWGRAVYDFRIVSVAERHLYK